MIRTRRLCPIDGVRYRVIDTAPRRRRLNRRRTRDWWILAFHPVDGRSIQVRPAARGISTRWTGSWCVGRGVLAFLFAKEEGHDALDR